MPLVIRSLVIGTTDRKGEAKAIVKLSVIAKYSQANADAPYVATAVR
ncbi:MAG: hypothetical protein U7123_16020 [Potamolinea sp.]